MSEEEVLYLIQHRLSIEVQTESVYTSSTEGYLYEDQHTVQLILDGNVISECSL